MKTDPFDDAIRRKLESVTPPFQEKSWTQFQRFMGHQGFPPSLWQHPARWLQPALVAASVVGVVLATVAQYRTTQLLTRQVQTLAETVERMEQVQLRLQQSVPKLAGTTIRVDTLYLTRSTSAEAVALGTLPGAGGLQSEQPPDEQTRTQNLPDRDQLVPNQGALSVGKRETGGGKRQPDPMPTSRERPGGVTYQHTPASTPPATEERMATLSKPEKTGAASNDYQGINHKSTAHLTQPNDANLYTPSSENLATANEATKNSGAITATGPLASVQPLTLRLLADPADALAENWQQRLRRVRYRSPHTTTGNTKATALPEKNTVPLPVRFRLGIGGDLAATQSGPGVYAEVIVADRLTIGTGVAQVTWASEQYGNETQFTTKTKRDFRRDYPGGDKPMATGPGWPREVLNISRTAQSLVIPLQIGYRFRIANQFTLTPTLGVNLGVAPRETATFDFERPGSRDTVLQRVHVSRPSVWYSNLTIGVGAERQWGHFVGQLSPVLLLPVRASDASLNTLTAGLRGRLFYQF